MCEIYFASKSEILCMSDLGETMFFMKDINNFFLKKLEAGKFQIYFSHEYAIAKLKFTVLYLVFKKTVSN